ncbi:hypothetical protein IC582_017567 [Cucumis melo]|uniref:Uncharacterized protein LOC103494838 n=2 Tax=Cucumis melo TaxID=3656 RepID=A0A1S3BYK8_CUCME|nr:uncharacterized protein LOC103494838 [Cucumis melo]KAA0044307.1 Formin-like protein 18 [Cucumis melo var. makuwa]TYK29438.1 Formin-like protein 18 [Cucumis melo var. makuwa]
MDPCPFLRILVGNLALKFPVAAKPSFSGVHPSTSPCFCKIKLNDFPTQFVTIPLLVDGEISGAASSSSSSSVSSQSHSSLAACFSLNKSQIEKLVKRKDASVKIEVYTGRLGPATCSGDVFGSSAKLLGRITVPVTGSGLSETKPCVFQNGWTGIGEGKKGYSSAQLHLTVRSEPDPRFVFRFDGEPECSPQVFQVQGSVQQPVFTCKFGFRNERDWDRSRSSITEQSSTSKSWLPKIRSERDQSAKERKGWSITIHDLSGSPVAAASMVTPFVPSPGSHRVSRSNPGAWLILRPVDGSWRPWGRLEAWRESGGSDSIGYRFELLPATSAAATLANSTISSGSGGRFTIDMTGSASPAISPNGSFDLGSGTGSRPGSGDFGYLTGYQYKGFVMSTMVEGMKKKSRRPEVEVGVQHVTCTEDAAVFVALAAAVDLSMDACRLFSQKLRKELRQ